MGMPTEAQCQGVRVTDEAPGEVDQILNHRLEPTALLDSPTLFAGHQADLPDGPQNVVGQPGTVHDQVVGGELARRQSLQIHIAFKLEVILLA